MALSKIWVHAEAADGKVAPITLEMLTKARELADTVEAFYAGGDADADRRRRSARTAPPRCTPPATSAARSRASPVAVGHRRADRGRQRARPDHVRHHLRRPRHRRPACR